jgi:hypothetical protein
VFGQYLTVVRGQRKTSVTGDETHITAHSTTTVLLELHPCNTYNTYIFIQITKYASAMEHIQIKTLNRKGQERTGEFVLSLEASIGLAGRLYFILFFIYMDSGVLNCNAVLTSSGLKMEKFLFSQTFVSNLHITQVRTVLQTRRPTSPTSSPWEPQL